MIKSKYADVNYYSIDKRFMYVWSIAQDVVDK